jgi:alpha-acetolactate decarboxylase
MAKQLPVNALFGEFYRDDIVIDTLKEKGDFGIGTLAWNWPCRRLWTT